MSNAAKAKELLFRFAASDACNEFTDSVCQLGSSVAILLLTGDQLAVASATEEPWPRIAMGAVLAHAGLNAIEDDELREKAQAYINEFLSNKNAMTKQPLGEEQPS